MEHQLAGKVAVVTGAASGIGHAITLAFLREGAKVVGADIAFAPPDLASADGFHAVVADLTDEGAPRSLLAECERRFGPVDILINNAGIGRARTILETSDAEFERFLAANLAAPFRLCREIIPTMRGRGGAIVNIASVFAMIGVAGNSGYVASKAGVAAMTHQLATEFGRDGIRVNAISPGLIATPLTQDRLDADTPWFRRMMIEGCPLHRPGKPEEIASACVFLASDAASFVTGVMLPVDGGWSSSKFLPVP